MKDDQVADETIIDVDVSSEMETSYLEYAYSVIYSRALPDARDGMKPVQRRIIYQMAEMGLRPDRGHVKSSRVIGDVMGKLHPHGDAAIYDALVRLSQDFTMRQPLVDGHGNFGSLDDGPAAPRYTEARLTKAAMAMVAGLDEDVVDFIPNYDNTLTQPERLPSAFPNLLVNGTSGIAVGMATNMAPHNLGEVIAATRHLIAHPDATLDELMKFVPGPDLPSGGRIIGLEGIRQAYATGRGSFKTRATCTVENVTARKKGIVVTELPYMVGPEKVSDKVKDAYKAGKLTGVTNIDDFSDRHHGLRLVIELKNGFNPDAVLETLYRVTPMEDSFGINNVTLVDGQPQTLGLKELLEVYIEHRLAVVSRRSKFRLAKNEARLHLVEGLLIAIVDIDEVIQLIRSSDDSNQAKTRLMTVFDLSDAQATYILDLQLRRLTKFSTIDLEAERDELRSEIERLKEILGDDSLLRQVVSTELGEVAEEFATPRRTILLEASAAPPTVAAGQGGKSAAPLEIPDDPCWVLLSTSGLIARSTDLTPLPAEGKRTKHDALVSQIAATARGDVGAVTSAGRLIKLPVLDMPTLPPAAQRVNVSGGAPIREFLSLEKNEKLIGLVPLGESGPGFALGTANGVVKRVAAEAAPNKDSWDVISLKPNDSVVGAAQLSSDDDELVFISSDAQLLRFAASKVRPQGRGAGGVAGMKLSPKATVIFFGAVTDVDAALVATVSSGEGLPGTAPMSAKVTPLADYPAKGRATGGVRAHRFLKTESALDLAWAGPGPSAASSSGVARVLPVEFGRRDGSGVPLERRLDAIGGVPTNAGGTAPGTAPDAADNPGGPDDSGLPAHESKSGRRATDDEKESIARAKPDSDGVVITDADPLF
ncbi:DNA gyrase/topoisomerase IV subunit A [Spelaeicoccus albus]|uniref:DNA topoisomerase (ATP-hydrolyzing) n=1 Tax=Spelaeicoccus albus TaxID=1280376 RepID=A0A7Z0D305_9MICO|nr:DNA topoisomerase IV subunit A [Spelaeicoccus albus]NYI67915.1 DNA gyrase subunit A [Spelaeicoccus albus]